MGVAPACSRLPLTPPGSPFARSKTKWQRSRRPAAFPSEKRTDGGFPFDRQRARECRQAAVLAALATPLRRGGHDQRVRLQSEGEGVGRGGGRPSVGTGRRSLRGARLARHRALSAGNRARFRETLSAHVLPGSDARQKPRAALGPELVPPSHVTAGVGRSFRLWPCQRRSQDVSRPRLLKTRISRSVKKTSGTRACTEGAMKNGGRMNLTGQSERAK